jgi:hypothetical protein
MVFAGFFWSSFNRFFQSLLCILVKAMSNAVLDNVYELIDIKDEKRRNSFGTVLLSNIVLDVSL